MVRPCDEIEWTELLSTLNTRDLDIILSYYFFGLTDEAIGHRYKRTGSWANFNRKKVLRNLHAELSSNCSMMPLKEEQRVAMEMRMEMRELARSLFAL